MRITKPNSLAGAKGNKSPARPDWFAEWRSSQNKYVLLECGCIEDVSLPKCIELLTGKKIYIECPFNEHHGFQLIKETLTFRDVLKARGLIIPDNPEGLFPPF